MNDAMTPTFLFFPNILRNNAVIYEDYSISSNINQLAVKPMHMDYPVGVPASKESCPLHSLAGGLIVVVQVGSKTVKYQSNGASLGRYSYQPGLVMVNDLFNYWLPGQSGTINDVLHIPAAGLQWYRVALVICTFSHRQRFSSSAVTEI